MNDLAIMNDATALVSSDHHEIAESVAQWLPVAMEAARIFGKRQTQFMDHVMTVSHPTPLRNLRQILAEVTSRKEALQENLYLLRKADVEHRRAIAKLRAMDNATIASDGFDREILAIEVEEKAAGLAGARLYVEGAIRQVAGYRAQYEAICVAIGKTEFTEMDVEREEEAYHIATAFAQALTAARARGGAIDEGNHIYLHQLGISGEQATREVRAFLDLEAKSLDASGGTRWPQAQSWVLAMAVKYAGCSVRVREFRGMIGTPIADATVDP